MKIFMIGGTGLLGSEAAKELIQRGHTVKSISLPPIPKGSNIPKEMELTLGNYMELSDEELKKELEGCEGLVFAAGIDERVEVKPGELIYEKFKKYNITPLERLLKIAKESGVKKAVILGSYFSYFAKEWKYLNLTKYHPYIRSRIDQEIMATSFAEDGKMDVAVLELPYIFGAQPGRKPVWLFIAEMLKANKGKRILYPKGGTTMVTVKQVAECVAGAIEKVTGAKTYPVGWFNMEWKEWLKIFSKYMGEEKKVFTIPTFLYKLNAKKMKKESKKKGIETGLDMEEYVKVMTANTFIDRKIIEKELGVKEDNIEEAIAESVKLCMDILNAKTEVIDMKGE